MNRKISYTLRKIERMKEHFAGTHHEEDINEPAKEYITIITSPRGVSTSTLQAINNDISSLGIR